MLIKTHLSRLYKYNIHDMGCSGCTFSKDIKEKLKSSDNSDIFLDSCTKLNTYDWLKDLPDTSVISDLVEIRFKNTRKEFFSNSNNINLQKDDIVVVEASPGHDTGIVSLTGKMAELQFKKKIRNPDNYQVKKIYRKATYVDLQKWYQGKARENQTMIKAREITNRLNLVLKIGDVEYQGDNTKATFYYIADDRVDFRKLIKVLAEEFRIRIEMKQIGSRQEAGRIGGLGSCGRELCCSTWRTNLESVPLSAAKTQELPANVQMLAGKCGKLKCCLMYELDSYLEAWQDFPKELLELETKKGTALRYKVDVLKKMVWYSYDPGFSSDLIPVTIERIKEIIMLNKKGIKPDDLNRT